MNPMTEFRGVRNSWLMLARNWVLARFAASASSLARRSASSARIRRVTSRPKATTPAMPRSSTMGLKKYS